MNLMRRGIKLIPEAVIKEITLFFWLEATTVML